MQLFLGSMQLKLCTQTKWTANTLSYAIESWMRNTVSHKYLKANISYTPKNEAIIFIKKEYNQWLFLALKLNTFIKKINCEIFLHVRFSYRPENINTMS